ncbi:hypothetical protein SASPL_115473 [Salvia splendens]|uniref:Uncharacterized protein n=1 Tax=Salvia splendens TaxID=180675 RepID=A0A8X8Y3U0_SALSN|nr:hypothetical protein SASPL_115473 [Salvia splendens]
MEAQSSREPDPPAVTTRLRSRPDPFLITCRCFSVITALAAILCIAVNILSAVQSFNNGSDIFDGIFRCYTVVISLFVVVAETEWEFIMKFSKILEYWAGRGMLQIFVAVMTRAYPEYLKDHAELFLLQSISSYLLLGCGVVYVISVRMCCIGMVKRARQKKEISREQAIKDLECRVQWSYFIVPYSISLVEFLSFVTFVCIIHFMRITNVAPNNNCRSLSSAEKNLSRCWSLKLDSELGAQTQQRNAVPVNLCVDLNLASICYPLVHFSHSVGRTILS